MNICSCFAMKPKRVYAEDRYGAKLWVVDTWVPICNGTKEREECSCNGDVAKCNFYPEKRGTKTMNTAEMYLAAQKGGRTYRCRDMLYSAARGLVDRYSAEDVPLDAFDDFDKLMQCQWHDDVAMTRKEAEEKLGVRIID